MLKNMVDHPGFPALHSAEESWVESPSGASAGQFLLDALICAIFSLMSILTDGFEEEDVEVGVV